MKKLLLPKNDLHMEGTVGDKCLDNMKGFDTVENKNYSATFIHKIV